MKDYLMPPIISTTYTAKNRLYYHSKDYFSKSTYDYFSKLIEDNRYIQLPDGKLMLTSRQRDVLQNIYDKGGQNSSIKGKNWLIINQVILNKNVNTLLSSNAEYLASKLNDYLEATSVWEDDRLIVMSSFTGEDIDIHSKIAEIKKRDPKALNRLSEQSKVYISEYEERMAMFEDHDPVVAL